MPSEKNYLETIIKEIVLWHLLSLTPAVLSLDHPRSSVVWRIYRFYPCNPIVHPEP